MVQIFRSVGRRGDNSPEDVLKVQRLLNRALGQWRSFEPIKENGQIDFWTTNAIELFQRVGANFSRPDGLISPRGRTIEALNRAAENAPPWADNRLVRPNWLLIAEAEIGVTEITGSEHNPRVIEYHASLSEPRFTDDNEDPWCSSFVNWVMTRAGYTGTGSPGSQSWVTWAGGQRIDRPAYGAIVVFYWGDGKGHCGFVVGKAGSQLLVLGGNQHSTMVTVSNFETSQIVAYQFPSGYTIPANAYDLDNAGRRGRGRAESAGSTR